jgi:glucokinase
LDCSTGVLLETPNIKGWEKFSITGFFSKELGAPCFLENDANCAALGEWSHSKVPDLVMITLGTGVGTGVISSNQLVRGVKGLGVEAGHMTINFTGPLCGCGKRGCFEAYVGGKLLVEHYNQKSNKKIQDLHAQEVFTRAKNGDPVATLLIGDWIYALAVGIGNLINIFNPTIITLTGGMSRGFSDYQEKFQEILLSQAFETSLKCSKVVVSQLQEKAGLLGAALWARQQLTKNFR